MISKKEKLILAQQQISNLVSLLEGNEYERFLCNKLISVHYELERQLSLLTLTNNSTKIEV